MILLPNVRINTTQSQEPTHCSFSRQRTNTDLVTMCFYKETAVDVASAGDGSGFWGRHIFFLPQWLISEMTLQWECLTHMWRSSQPRPRHPDPTTQGILAAPLGRLRPFPLQHRIKKTETHSPSRSNCHFWSPPYKLRNVGYLGLYLFFDLTDQNVLTRKEGRQRKESWNERPRVKFS